MHAVIFITNKYNSFLRETVGNFEKLVTLQTQIIRLWPLSFSDAPGGKIESECGKTSMDGDTQVSQSGSIGNSVFKSRARL